MILDELKNIKAEKKNLRQFVALFFLVLALVGGWRLRHGNVQGWFFCAAAAGFGVFGWIWPFWVKPFYRVWMGIAVVMGHVVSRVVLALTFYGVMTPLGLFFGRRDRSFSRHSGAESCWIPRKEAVSGPEKYERQF